MEVQIGEAMEKFVSCELCIEKSEYGGFTWQLNFFEPKMDFASAAIQPGSFVHFDTADAARKNATDTIGQISAKFNTPNWKPKVFVENHE